MWQSPTPIKSFFGKELMGREAWIQVYAATWEALEIDKEELWVPALKVFGTAVAEKHGDEDTAAVARRLCPEAGDYFGDLYPASVRRPPNPASFPRPHDVPFYR